MTIERHERVRTGLVVAVGLLVIVFAVALDCKAPSNFVVESLDITPPETTAGTTVSIIAKVRNSGGSEGKYTAALTVNGIKVEMKDILVAPGATETVGFSLVKNEAGSYQVTIGELSENFTVKFKLAVKEIELKYDKGQGRDSLSTSGGHIVDFSPPAIPFTIKTIKIAGLVTDGGSGSIDELKKRFFDLQILDKDLKNLYTVTCRYDKFPSDYAAWINFDIPDLIVSDKFYVHTYTNSPRFGLHIGADDSVPNEHSDITTRGEYAKAIISPIWPYSRNYWFGDKSKVNWMIRVVGTCMVPQE